jgi:hypothetical protein
MSHPAKSIAGEITRVTNQRMMFNASTTAFAHFVSSADDGVVVQDAAYVALVS